LIHNLNVGRNWYFSERTTEQLLDFH
jgi:hypothetical protein